MKSRDEKRLTRRLQVHSFSDFFPVQQKYGLSVKEDTDTTTHIYVFPLPLDLSVVHNKLSTEFWRKSTSREVD